MSYADAQADHTRVVKLIWDLRAHLLGAYLTNTDAVKDNLDDYESVTAAALTQALASHRVTMAGLRATARALLTLAHVRIAEEIGSGALSGGAITDPERFFRDWRNHQLGIDAGGGDEGETVPGRAVTYAADPAAGDGLQYLRLTVDELGQKIESGIHNETVTARVTQTALTGAGFGRVTSEIFGQDGGVDDLDYRRGSGSSSPVTLEQTNLQNPNTTRNAGLLVSGIALTNGTDVTDASLRQWDIVRADSPVIKVRTGSTGEFAGKTYGIAVSGNGSEATFRQSIVSITESRFTPRLPFTVLHYDGTWQGDITITWGGRSHVIAHTSLGSAGFKVLFPPRDANIHPVNFDAASPTIAVTIETTSATGELVLHMIDMAVGVEYQNVWYFSLPQSTTPVLNVDKTWSDSVTFAGRRQDVIAWAFDEEPWAYLNTVAAAGSGAPWADPS